MPDDKELDNEKAFDRLAMSLNKWRECFLSSWNIKMIVHLPMENQDDWLSTNEKSRWLVIYQLQIKVTRQQNC